MSCEEARWPGFWNSVNSASNSRTMMTQSAKLRRLAFIPIRLSCSGPVHAGSPAARLLATIQRRPDVYQCRSANATCQGKRPAQKHRNSAHSNPARPPCAEVAPNQLWLWLRPNRGGASRRLRRAARARRRAGRRSGSRRRPPGCVETARCLKKRQVPHEALRACQARPSPRCRCRRWRGRAGASVTSAGNRPNWTAGNAIGPASGHGSGANAATAASTTASSAASARRTRRASSASRSALSPSRSRAGIAARSLARVKRGSRLLGSSA